MYARMLAEESSIQFLAERHTCNKKTCCIRAFDQKIIVRLMQCYIYIHKLHAMLLSSYVLSVIVKIPTKTFGALCGLLNGLFIFFHPRTGF